jgi:hypothetical protein
MKISKQKQLVIQIQNDLKKEAARLRRLCPGHVGEANKVAADDCVDQAEDLKEVLESLTTLEEIYSVAKRIGCNWRKGH